MRIINSRFYMSKKQTVSTCIVPGFDFFFYIMEDPWINNKPFVSCIPAGLYSLVKHNSIDHPDTWALVNTKLGVYHHIEDIPTDKQRTARYECLIHPGNWVYNFKGCMGPGMAYNNIDMVEDSQRAFHMIQAVLMRSSDGNGHEILILQPYHLGGN